MKKGIILIRGKKWDLDEGKHFRILGKLVGHRATLPCTFSILRYDLSLKQWEPEVMLPDFLTTSIEYLYCLRRVLPRLSMNPSDA